MSLKSREIESTIIAMASPERAASMQRFFKTGDGEYAAGDQFLGLSNPQIRNLVKELKPISVQDCQLLLKSKWHEIRFFALVMMVALFKPKKSELKDTIVELYLANTCYVNNWDLVDCSSYHILGEYLQNKDYTPILRLAASSNMWERRIAIVSTYAFIRRGIFKPTLQVADILLLDKEDLIQKATGWMLKEVGKRDQSLLCHYLQAKEIELPRVLLRTAIEKLPVEQKSRLNN
ncbi:DNA alkylation repair protein [Aliikangiella sp. G2MR2-5]|uniref:DNA alkylation repair protein n=1 Tax=Aliikangiella sp. G2MR2-5 TaxID=2788943 RepID=UPI001AED54E2|nr:DNA alkylation repair protein [Aliikangiella sp. G2MR2-5]